MATVSKQETVTEIKANIADASAVLLVEYRGLTVKQISELRANLREAEGQMVVYKNRLTEIALRELAYPSLGELLQGPTACVFVNGDPVAAAKALKKFKTVSDKLVLKGGLLGMQVIDASGAEKLATLPSREELLAKLLGTLQNPMRGAVTVMSGPARGLVTALDAIVKQKSAA